VPDSSSRYHPAVRAQYESFPYPPRNPADELARLLLTEMDALGKVSYYCFQGRLDLRENIRILVAGGGTGDAAIFLAEQLRGHPGEVVYLDISRASMEIAMARARVRKLDNIRWVSGSLLDIPQLDLGCFDYINCSGVLHHLEDPVEGLRVTASALAPRGVLGIMVYAKYGRTGVYHFQELMRLFGGEDTELAEILGVARSLIHSLPNTHTLKCGPIPLTSQKAAELEDADIVDLFLHPQDRAYTVSELYDWLHSCNLELVDFVCSRHLYEPETHVDDSQLLGLIGRLPRPQQQAIAENMGGNLYKHVFYTGKATPRRIDVDDLNNIPYFCDLVPLSAEERRLLQEYVMAAPIGRKCRLHFPRGNSSFEIQITPTTGLFFRFIDGQRTLGKIIKLVQRHARAAGIQRPDLKKEFRQLFRQMSCKHALLLRGRTVPAYKTYAELQAGCKPRRHPEGLAESGGL